MNKLRAIILAVVVLQLFAFTPYGCSVPIEAYQWQMNLKHPDPEKRSDAAKYLGIFCSETGFALDSLYETYDDENAEVRYEVLTAINLMEKDKNRLFDVLTQTLFDPDPMVQEIAVTIFWKNWFSGARASVWYTPEYYDMYVELAESHNLSNQALGISVLTHFYLPDEKIRAIVIKATTSEDRQLANLAIKNLRGFEPDEEIIRIIADAIESGSWETRLAAIWAVQYHPHLVDRFSTKIKELAETDPKSNVRVEAERILKDNEGALEE